MENTKNKPCESQCQSCGLPFNSNPGMYGTEKDGTNSTMYCSLCYKDGELLWKDATPRQMQELVREKMTEKGYWWPIKMMARYQIPHLKRWRKG